MSPKPVKEEIHPGQNKLIENYFNHYKIILNIFKLSYVFFVFIYYAICALCALYASVLLLFVFITVSGKYIG